MNNQNLPIEGAIASEVKQSQYLAKRLLHTFPVSTMTETRRDPKVRWQLSYTDFVEKIYFPVDNIPMITYDDFKKLDIRIGTVISAERIQGTDKLLILDIDFGTEKRHIVAGIAEMYQPDQLIGKGIPTLLNLEPRRIRGVESHGMILAVDVDGKPILLLPERDAPPGSIVR